MMRFSITVLIYCSIDMCLQYKINVDCISCLITPLTPVEFMRITLCSHFTQALLSVINSWQYLQVLLSCYIRRIDCSIRVSLTFTMILDLHFQ